MATYPTLPTSPGSDPEPINKIDIDRAEDGTARGRAYGSDKHRMQLEHPWLTAAEKATLAAFYSANRLLPFDYVSPCDGVSRAMLFSKPIAYRREVGQYWTAKVEAEEV